MQQALLTMGVMDAKTAASLIKNVDSDGDGRIRCGSAQEYCSPFPFPPQTANKPHHKHPLFCSLSLSRPSSYEEFLMAALDRKMLDNQNAMWWAFCEYDKNGDGKITAEEIRHVLKDQSADIEKYIAEYDTNQDGVIDYSEFVMMLLPKDLKVKQSLPSRGRVPESAMYSGGGGGGGK